jgi:hypothetical protein
MPVINRPVVCHSGQRTALYPDHRKINESSLLTTVTARKNRSGKTFLYVDTSQHNSLFRPKFDETGKLLEGSETPLQELYRDGEVTDRE